MFVLWAVNISDISCRQQQLYSVSEHSEKYLCTQIASVRRHTLRPCHFGRHVTRTKVTDDRNNLYVWLQRFPVKTWINKTGKVKIGTVKTGLTQTGTTKPGKPWSGRRPWSVTVCRVREEVSSRISNCSPLNVGLLFSDVQITLILVVVPLLGVYNQNTERRKLRISSSTQKISRKR